MWDLDHKESWVLKNWCFWTVVLEKTFENPLDCKKIQPVHPKGNQSWIFIGRTDAEAEASIFWPPDTKHWLIGKDPYAGQDWRQEEKRTTEDKIVGCSRSWWWTGKPSVLQSMGSHGVTYDWVTELYWTELNFSYFIGSCHFRSNAKMMVINGAQQRDKNENCGGCVSSNDSFSLGTDGNILMHCFW